MKIKKALFVDFYKILVDNNVNINHYNFKGLNPLSIAIENENWTFLDFILNESNLNLLKIYDKKSTILHNCENLFKSNRG